MANASIKCRRCKTLFTPYAKLGQLCPSCMQKEEDEYHIVRSYVKDNPGISILELSEILDIPRNKIMNYVRQERLEIKNFNHTYLFCKNCGSSITSGLFCDKCKSSEKITVRTNTEYDNKIKRNEAYRSKYYNR